MIVNLNNLIKIRLNELGLKIIKEHYLKDNLGSETEIEIYLKYKIDKDGALEISLREFMNVFGEHFIVGADPVTINNRIEI